MASSTNVRVDIIGASRRREGDGGKAVVASVLHEP